MGINFSNLCAGNTDVSRGNPFHDTLRLSSRQLPIWAASERENKHGWQVKVQRQNVERCTLAPWNLQCNRVTPPSSRPFSWPHSMPAGGACWHSCFHLCTCAHGALVVRSTGKLRVSCSCSESDGSSRGASERIQAVRSVIIRNGCQIREWRGQLRPESPLTEHDPKIRRDTTVFLFQSFRGTANRTGTRRWSASLCFYVLCPFRTNSFAAVAPHLMYVCQMLPHAVIPAFWVKSTWQSSFSYEVM